nr:condensation domain-containing protein [Rhizobium sp. T1473]
MVDRHDILRTAFVWEGLSSPAQVVWRKAVLEVREVELDEDGGPGSEQLKRRFDPRQDRIDLGRAPLLRIVIAREPGSGRWLLLQLLHHLIGDHTTLEVMHAEVRAVLDGRGMSWQHRSRSAIWWRRRGWVSMPRRMKRSSGRCWPTSTSRRCRSG